MPVKIRWNMKDIQQTIQSLLVELFEQGAERGVQVVAYRNGELLVDACAGTTDAVSGRPVDAKTLFPVFSTTKGIAATLAHIVVEQGKIGYDTPIAEVWPEFAVHGKEGITLRHALDHTAGLPKMPMHLSHAQLIDWNFMCAAIADLTPISEPGWKFEYHAITYSWTVGEVVRRVGGAPFSELLRKEIGLPLGIADDMFVGIPDEAEPRVAVLELATSDYGGEPPDDTVPQAIPALVHPLWDWMNRPDARRACIPGSNGIMTAGAIAKHYAALLPGGVAGTELLPPQRVRLATEMMRPLGDATDAPPSNRALGYQLGAFFSPRTFGHNGYGGSVGLADPESGLALGFTRNRCADDKSMERIAAALKSEIDGAT
jgi:CubicO group peptidase (beta-lactamase class C family)